MSEAPNPDPSGSNHLGTPPPPPASLPSVYPRKLFYRIQEVADIVGVEPYVLRYWETKFPMLQPEKDAADQRRYRQRDIDLLLRIRDLLYAEKYTIAGAVERLRLESPHRGRPAHGTSSPTTGRLLQTPDLFATGDPEKTPSNGALREATPLPILPAQESRCWSPESDSNQTRRSDAIERLRAELGLLKRELIEWRDELA